VVSGQTALPALLIGGLAYQNARRTVEMRVKAQLTSVADLKKDQITAWLDDRAADARLLADNFLNEEHFTEILDPRTDPAHCAASETASSEALIAMADQALYMAKRLGRNRVCVWEPGLVTAPRQTDQALSG
jgi:hypothetical protein